MCSGLFLFFVLFALCWIGSVCLILCVTLWLVLVLLTRVFSLVAYFLGFDFSG